MSKAHEAARAVPSSRAAMIISGVRMWGKTICSQKLGYQDISCVNSEFHLDQAEFGVINHDSIILSGATHMDDT